MQTLQTVFEEVPVKSDKPADGCNIVADTQPFPLRSAPDSVRSVQVFLGRNCRGSDTPPGKNAVQSARQSNRSAVKIPGALSGLAREKDLKPPAVTPGVLYEASLSSLSGEQGGAAARPEKDLPKRPTGSGLRAAPFLFAKTV